MTTIKDMRSCPSWNFWLF